MTYEVLDKEACAAREKELKEAYAAASKKYDSLTGDEKNQAKKPVRPVVKKMKTTNDASNAEKIAMDLRNKHEAK